MRVLLVNLHSSHNAGDHALTLEAVRQLRLYLDEPEIVLAMNDPASYEEGEETVGSFYTWLTRPTPGGGREWRWFAIPFLLLFAVVAGGVWRISRRLPRLGLAPEQHRLLRAYADADVVISCAGNFLYSSGRVGLPFFLAVFTVAYGWLLGKPIYTLPQSIGPLHRGWERALVRWLAGRMRLVMVREPRSLALLKELGADARKCRLVPDIAFAYPDADHGAAACLLQETVGPEWEQVPLLGMTLMNWGAQNRHFQKQARYEEAIRATIEAFLEQTGGQVVLFAQVWGPTDSEDDRVPARRVASSFARTGRVHAIDRPLSPAALKGCYARMELLLGTRMHSNIFALSEGTPVLAIGYRTKTWGIMEMLGMEQWLVDIEEASAERLPDRLMQAWEAREVTRCHVATVLPKICEQASRAVELLRDDLQAMQGSKGDHQ
jgi:colanic acid/amylovoran biosynthesis protein